MIKLIDKNSIYLIGKIKEVKLHLASIEDKSITLVEYISQQALLYRKSLN